MTITFKAAKRVEQGTGASRRLRHAGKVPGIIYGAGKTPIQIELDHNELYHMLRKEAFHSSMLVADFGAEKDTVVLRDAQWHPFRQQILHLDFQRVDPNAKMHIKVPLHFINADVAPGVKADGGVVSHVLTELEIETLPGNLPEFLTVDLMGLSASTPLHVSNIVLPEGVTTVIHGDPVVAALLKTRADVAADEAEAAVAAESAAASAAAAEAKA